MNTLAAPSIDAAALVPIATILFGAVLGLAVETFMPRRGRRVTEIVLSLLVIGVALAATVWRLTVVLGPNGGPTSIFKPSEQMDIGTLIEDAPALVFQFLILFCSLLAVLVMADRTATGEGSFAASAATEPGSYAEREVTEAGFVQTEVFPLTLFSISGMMAFAAAGDLLTLFVSLELLSLPLYVLTATARRRRTLSQEAAIKYFLLGAFSSAFFLLGAAFLYGYAGSVNMLNLATLPKYSAGLDDRVLILGVVLVLVGLLFKVGAVPFHSWTPDVYQGAPTPVTGFMAAGTKIAAYAAMLRFVYVVGHNIEWDIIPFMWVVIVVTMLVGTVLGIVQKDVKRMLAYSSIAHTGFMLIAVISFEGIGVGAIAMYMAAYGLASVGAFAVVTLVRERGSEGDILGEATKLDSWRGLGRTNPALAVAMMIFLLSFAGIPLTAGFMGKFLVFSAGVSAGHAWLVVLAVLASAATAFFYFRLLLLMFFEEPDQSKSVVVDSEGPALVAIMVAAILTLLLGIVPGPLMNLLENATVFLL